MARRPRGLTDRQRRFCEEYLVDLNASQAAIRAGYARKTANNNAARLMVNEGIRQAIAEGQAKVSARLTITIERIVQEYARLAFLDIRKLFNDRGDLVPVGELDDDTAAALAGLEVETVYECVDGKKQEVGRLKRIKLASKLGALDSLAKHLGMFVDRGEPKPSGEAAPRIVIFAYDPRKVIEQAPERPARPVLPPMD